MTDEDKALVERLRGDWPEILVEKHWMMDSDAIDKQREEAANRIEAQAAEIDYWKTEARNVRRELKSEQKQTDSAMDNYDAMQRRCEAQAVEIEKLREALKDIQIEAEREKGNWTHLKQVIARKARAALGETK